MIGLLRKIKAWLTPIVLPIGTPTKYPDEWAILKKFNKYTRTIEYSLILYYYAGIKKPNFEVSEEIINTVELKYFYNFRTTRGTVYKSPKTGEILGNDELDYLAYTYLKSQIVSYKEYRNYIN